MQERFFPFFVIPEWKNIVHVQGNKIFEHKCLQTPQSLLSIPFDLLIQ